MTQTEMNKLYSMKVKHSPYPKVKFESGTVDRYQQKSYYFNILGWYTPNGENLHKPIQDLFKSVKASVMELKKDEWFKDIMISFDTTPVYCNPNNPHFITFEFTLYRKPNTRIDKLELLKHFNELADGIYYKHFDKYDTLTITNNK